MIISEINHKDYHSTIKVAVLGVFNRIWNVNPDVKDQTIDPLRLPEYLTNVDLNRAIKAIRESSKDDREFLDLMSRLNSVVSNIGPNRKFNDKGKQIS